MKLPLPRSFGTAFGLVPPVAVIAVAGAFLWRSEAQAPRTLKAFDLVANDQDGDGLTDREEALLQTSPFLADTDGDGFSDTEELARQMSRLVPDSAPVLGRLRVGATVCDQGTQLSVVLAVYLPDTDLRTKDLRLGLVAGRRVVELSREQILEDATVEFVPALSEDAVIAVIRIPFSPQALHLYGELSLYTTVGNVGSGVVAASSAVRLVSIDNVPLLCLPDPFAPTTSNTSNGPGVVAQQSGSSTATNGGTIFVPLTFGDDPPALWTPGQICYQKSSPVGANGLLVTHEVVRADCMDNWDAFCPPSCSASVGTTFEDVDPLALLGG